MRTLSASQLKDWRRCPRAWWLRTVARVSDDGRAGGQYLAAGDALDEAVQLYSAKMDVTVDALVARIRAGRGAALSLTPEKTRELAERAQRQLRTIAPHLPAPKTADVQFKYRVAVPGEPGWVITGKPDLRRPGDVTDTKTTSDRGPGRGAGPDRPAYALTAATLAADEQAALYAWCEFQLDPNRATVRLTWVYAAKDSAEGWPVSVVVRRPEVLAWFDLEIRPALREMTKAWETWRVETDAEAAPSDSACGRCFSKLSCNPYDGAQRRPTNQKESEMPFDLKKLKAAQTTTPAAQPVAVTEAGNPVFVSSDRGPGELGPGVVAVNRPKDHAGPASQTEAASPAPPSPVVAAAETSPPAAVVATISAASVGSSVADAEDVPPPPVRRRRRTRAELAAAATPSDPAKALENHLEDLATAFQTFADKADAAVRAVDQALATLRAGGSRGA